MHSRSSSISRPRTTRPADLASSAGAVIDTLEPRVLLAADPITTDHPLWTMTRSPGAITIDGDLSDPAWRSAMSITRAQAYRENSSATIRMLYDNAGVYLSAEVSDEWIWIDGRGDGVGRFWEIEQDDSVSFYFDMDKSRDAFFADADRMVGVGLGPQNGPENGEIVTRYKWIKGDGLGSGVGVNFGALLDDGIAYASAYNGTPNDNSDSDIGWSTEIFVPWASLGRTSAPAHGFTFAMNFDVIFDNDGGVRDLNVNRRGADKWTLPGIIDDHLQGVHSSSSSTQAGLKGPTNYAEVMIVDANAASAPRAVSGLSADTVTGYSAHLKFIAPAGTTGGAGHPVGYLVRYSSTPITSQAAWDSATVFHNAYVPRLAGETEDIRLIGLSPSTTYHVAVRAVDALGNPAPLSNSFSFTTQSATQDPSNGERVVPSPMGRTFVLENGTPFVMVGDHIGSSWKYWRSTYPGDVWDRTNDIFQNFYENTPVEGTYDAYMADLADQGINTMRVYLELQSDIHNEDNPDGPNGWYWLEYPRGTFNPDMRDHMLLLLEAAERHDMHLIFSPFGSYFWPETFETMTPWHTSAGGPLTDLDNFFQTPETLDIAKNRMDVVIQWLKSSPYAHRAIGWEVMSEWDAMWTQNAEGDSTPSRDPEMQRRAIFIGELASYIKQQDPSRLVLQSTIAPDPRGPVARLAFNHRAFDAATPHLYAMGNEEGVNNPHDDILVKPAFDNANLTAYWISSDELRRPVINGEWGPTREVWPGGTPTYSPDFTADDDNGVYRVMMWSGLASGQVGTGLRMPSATLADNGFLLSDIMRGIQTSVRAFTDSSYVGVPGVAIDWADFAYNTLAGRVSAFSPTGKSVHAWGVSDGAQGIVYLLHDRNNSAGTVGDAVLSVAGLDRDMVVDVEFWSPDANQLGPISVTEAVYVGVGNLSLTLPAFNEDLVLKFRARPKAPEQPQVVVGLRAGPRQLTFALDEAGRPFATQVHNVTGATTEISIARITRFIGRITDMTAYVRGTNTNVAYLAATDENRHLWLFTGNLLNGVWTARDLTQERNFPGVTGDLTTYQPKWGSIHIGGVDAKGNAINYWFTGGLPDWQFANLTRRINGPTLVGGLTSYVTSWNGLNLAGVNSSGDVVVYWWSPALGEGNWSFLNMTQRFSLPALVGQIDAFVSAGGGLNIVGVDGAGDLQQYWWKPGLTPEPNRWRVRNLSDESGGPTLQPGAQGFVAADGNIYVFSTTADDDLIATRYHPTSATWLSTNVTQETSSSEVGFPIGGSIWGSILRVGARARSGDPTLILYRFDPTGNVWSALDTGEVIAG